MSSSNPSSPPEPPQHLKQFLSLIQSNHHFNSYQKDLWKYRECYLYPFAAEEELLQDDDDKDNTTDSNQHNTRKPLCLPQDISPESCPLLQCIQHNQVHTMSLLLQNDSKCRDVVNRIVLQERPYEGYSALMMALVWCGNAAAQGSSSQQQLSEDSASLLSASKFSSSSSLLDSVVVEDSSQQGTKNASLAPPSHYPLKRSLTNASTSSILSSTSSTVSGSSVTTIPPMCLLLLKHATPSHLLHKNQKGENLLFIVLRKSQSPRSHLLYYLTECNEILESQQEKPQEWNLNERERNGQSLLHQSAGLGRLGVVDLLLSLSKEVDDPKTALNVNDGDWVQGDTAMHFAMHIHMKRLIPDLGEPDYGILYRLIRLGGHVDKKSNDGLTCLSFCEDDIAPLFRLLDSHREEMPEYLEQLMTYPMEFVMNQFTFLTPEERNVLWEALEAIREEKEVEESTLSSGCPVTIVKQGDGARRRRRKREQARMQEGSTRLNPTTTLTETTTAENLPTEQADNDSSSSKCPFLATKRQLGYEKDEANVSKASKSDAISLDAGLNSEPASLSTQAPPKAGGKCPIPFVDSLYYGISSSKGFIAGLGVGVGLSAVLLFTMRSQQGQNSS